MPQATDGDIYVNDGDTYTNGVYYPGQPEERTAAEIDEANVVAASFPVLGEVADWFSAQIANCPKINNVQVSSTTINGVKYSREIHVEAQVLAYQLLEQLLREKASDFAAFTKEARDA